MKKYFSILLTGLLSLSALQLVAAPNRPLPPSSPPTSRSQIQWCGSYQDALQNARTKSRPVLILFTGTNWCPACMKLEREVLSKPEFAQAVANKFVFYRAEFPEASEESIMSSPDKPLMDTHHVEAFPTMVVVDANGRRLFNVEYHHKSGPNVYIQEINQKLAQHQIQ